MQMSIEASSTLQHCPSTVAELTEAATAMVAIANGTIPETACDTALLHAVRFVSLVHDSVRLAEKAARS